MRPIDLTSRLGQFAWQQITPSTIPLPVIFRNDNREEYLCVQMINIHLLSKFSSEILSYYLKQFSLQYYSITQFEAKLFQIINQFHSNGYLNKSNQLNYSKLHLSYITPYLSFRQFYQFISSNTQLIKNNTNYFSSITTENKSEIIMNSSSLLNERKPTTNSYRRSITFHEKEIESFVTTSLSDSNQIILCLSIKDIISKYFPLFTPEQFIQLCRLKQIIRYKPDKSTKSDLSLRLINIQQLEQYWQFFNNEQSNLQSSVTNDSPVLTVEESSGNISSIINSQLEKSTCQINLISSIDENESIQFQINSLLNELIQRIEEQNHQLIKQEEEEEKIILSTIENNKTMKRKRSQSQKCPFITKRRRRKQSKQHEIEWWFKKYSIEPISIRLHRVSLPTID